MLVTEGAARSEQIDRTLAVLLALVAGALNAGAFHAAGFFAANMTGNISAASDYLALGSWGRMIFFIWLIVSFIAGACVSALLIAAGHRHGMRQVYGYVLLGEALLLAALGAMAPGVPEPAHTIVVVQGLAFLMGLQNALVTRISGARVRTTHISGMATDVGMEIAALWEAARGRDAPGGAAENRRRLSLHASTIFAFFAGGVAGVMVYRQFADGLLLMAAAVVAAIALAGILSARV